VSEKLKLSSLTIKRRFDDASTSLGHQLDSQLNDPVLISDTSLIFWYLKHLIFPF